jgi:hypothetical protein
MDAPCASGTFCGLNWMKNSPRVPSGRFVLIAWDIEGDICTLPGHQSVKFTKQTQGCRVSSIVEAEARSDSCHAID